jgi:hypothetical protein
MLLSIVSGPSRFIIARQTGAPTGFDPCHIPTKKDGDDDAGGKSDGKAFHTDAQGMAAEAGYVNDVEYFRRKPTGEVRYFAGAKNGAKVPGLDSKKNSSMRGWTLIHGAAADNCCHTATLQTGILLNNAALIPKPAAAGLSVVTVEAEGSVDQFADNCAESRPLKKEISRKIGLLALRSRDAFGNVTDIVDAFDSENPGMPNPQFDSAGSVTLQVTLKGTENWFFTKKTHMEFKGTATIKKVQAGAGQDQRAEGTAWVFKSSSKYSDADNGNLNQCSN